LEVAQKPSHGSEKVRRRMGRATQELSRNSYRSLGERGRETKKIRKKCFNSRNLSPEGKKTQADYLNR